MLKQEIFCDKEINSGKLKHNQYNSTLGDRPIATAAQEGSILETLAIPIIRVLICELSPAYNNSKLHCCIYFSTIF